jgi:hypothetical protein
VARQHQKAPLTDNASIGPPLETDPDKPTLHKDSSEASEREKVDRKSAAMISATKQTNSENAKQTNKKQTLVAQNFGPTAEPVPNVTDDIFADTVNRQQ